MRLAAARFLASALALAAQATAARAADPGEEAARSYTIEATGPATLKPGGTGTLVLAIKPTAKVHVHPQAPLKIALTATPGLTLGKSALGRKDLADPKAEAPRFEVPVTAAAAGKQEASAKVDFFICSDQWCVKQVRDVKVAIDVK
jgi:hypothetical protein